MKSESSLANTYSQSFGQEPIKKPTSWIMNWKYGSKTPRKWWTQSKKYQIKSCLNWDAGFQASQYQLANSLVNLSSHTWTNSKHPIQPKRPSSINYGWKGHILAWMNSGKQINGIDSKRRQKIRFSKMTQNLKTFGEWKKLITKPSIYWCLNHMPNEKSPF